MSKNDSARIYPYSIVKIVVTSFCTLLLAGCGTPVTGAFVGPMKDGNNEVSKVSQPETEPTVQPQAVTASAESTDSPNLATAETEQNTVQVAAKTATRTGSVHSAWTACGSDPVQVVVSEPEQDSDTVSGPTDGNVEATPKPPAPGTIFEDRIELPNGDTFFFDGTIVEKDGTVGRGRYEIQEDGTITVYYEGDILHFVQVTPDGLWSEAELCPAHDPFEDDHHWDWLDLRDLGYLRGDGAVFDQDGEYVGDADIEEDEHSIKVILPDGTIWVHDRDTDVRYTIYTDGTVRTENPDGTTTYLAEPPIADPAPVALDIDPVHDGEICDPAITDQTSDDEQSADLVEEQDATVVDEQDIESDEDPVSVSAEEQDVETIDEWTSAPLETQAIAPNDEQDAGIVEVETSDSSDLAPSTVEPVSDPAPEQDVQTAEILDSDPVEAQVIDAVVESDLF